MKNRWSDKEARAFVRRQSGVPSALAATVYASRLLGAEQTLVRHGGGNSSIKYNVQGLTGETLKALLVKGSGQDMETITAAGFSALRLNELQAAEILKSLSDGDMLRQLAAAKIDPAAPRPSVETLFHAFLPHACVLHSHANAVLALTNQPDGRKLCEQVYGDQAVILPYAMSGFDLAKKAASAWRKNPEAKAVVVMKHGLFTFGDSARDAYSRMIELVSLAERHLKASRKKPARPAPRKASKPSLSEMAPVLRGALMTDGDQVVLEPRTGKAIRTFVDGKDVARYASAGPVTPDHVIWTKPFPLVLGGNESAAIHRAVNRYRQKYERYFAKNVARVEGLMAMRDSTPRVVLVPGLGLFGVGETAAAAKIAADLAETNAEVILAAEVLGRYTPASKADVFDIEYWSPETAKLDTRPKPRLQGKIVAVTGGGSGIGAATARAFAQEGAEVVVLDLNAGTADRVAGDCNGLGIGCDVTEVKSIRRAFDHICKTYGGIDILVSNAGAAWQGEIGTVSDKVLRDSFELNFFAHQSVAQAAVRIMRAQGAGGCLLFNTSKQAVNPGREFGPYGLPKAATLFLVRQYAVDHGKDGIRTGGVNADRIRTGLLDDRMIADRSSARGVSEDKYMSGNLLGREVTADDVAKAFVDLALSPSTTGAVLTVDGGNIEAALR